MAPLHLTIVSALSIFVALAAGQAAPYGQCGGTGWTGATTCTSGWTCTAVSPPWYSQCLPSSSSQAATSTTATTTRATTTGSTSASTPSVYLVGDSTMASHSASEGIQGWGVPFASGFLTIPIVNRARSGSSARSWIRDGFWYNTKQLLKSGDYVVIELGHNDGGGPTASTQRGSVVGEGSETVTVTLTNGTTEVVHTFNYYIGLMIDEAKAKGAHPIVSSATPNNPYENVSTISSTPSRFEGYAKNTAAAKGVPFVSHFNACISLYSSLGKATTESYFPNDHTHTNAAGAAQVANAFISGLKCTSAQGALASYFTSSSKNIQARC